VTPGIDRNGKKGPLEASVNLEEEELLWSHGQSLHRTELIITHEQHGSSPLPYGTAWWLDARPKIEHWHHMRLPVEGDFERLVRHLTGSSVGLVMAGGGSRGLAHLGVLKACVEQSVPIDFVGGTSQGAFMAACWGGCQDIDEMQHRVEVFAQGMGSTWELIKDMTLPIHSYFHGGKFSWAVRHCLDGLGAHPKEEHYMEDLWTPTFVVVTKVGETAAEIRTRGKTWEMVRASMTLIGLIPPMFDKGDLLVDGGYANNLPVDVMRRLVRSGHVIAVDVENKDKSNWKDNDDLVDSEGGVSGWNLLGRRLLSSVFDIKSKWPDAQAMNEWLSFMKNNQDIRHFIESEVHMAS